MPQESQNSERSRRWLWIVVSLLILIVTIGVIAIADGPWQTSREAQDIVARVNGSVVTRGELRRVQVDLLALRQLQGKQGDAEPTSLELERLALQQLIQRRLMLEEAGRRKVSINGAEFDQALVELRGRFADLQSLGVWMQERGLDDKSLMETIRADVLMSRVTAALVKDVAVSEEQVQDYYETHKQDLTIGEEVRLRIITVKSREAAEQVLKALREGVKFADLARQISLGARAAEGGDTGWVDPMTLPPALRETVARLKVGEASKPIEKNADEFLIVALAGQRPVRATSLEQARPEIERRLLTLHRQRAIQAWITEQEEKSQIDVFL